MYVKEVNMSDSTIRIFDRQYDCVIKSWNVTIGVTYRYAVDNFVPLIDKLDYQRNPLRASFYKRLEMDLIKGCTIPNITLAIHVNKPIDEKEINESFLEEELKDAFVLDGIQRLNTMKRVCNEEGFPFDRTLHCNVLIGSSMDRLLYRMITLNNGQRPMTARHQIEILASNIIDFDSLNILSVTEKEMKKKKRKNTTEEMSKEVIIKGYLAFVSNSINIDNQKIIEERMDALIAEKILDSNLPNNENEYSEVIEYINEKMGNDYLKEWFRVPNNFIGFSAAMSTNFNEIKNVDEASLVDGIELFEKAFSAIDVSKIKLGLARRRLVKMYFEKYGTNVKKSESDLIDEFSMVI